GLLTRPDMSKKWGAGCPVDIRFCTDRSETETEVTRDCEYRAGLWVFVIRGTACGGFLMT
ncbi:MAG: hypothetical protein K5929_07730, partial [Lachnospiraceae bacterium]|nr:hypothetical protein [Lachnospiraceae bacterium]